MPIYKEFSDAKMQVILWKYEEGERYDIKELLEPENYEKVKNYHPKKLLETLLVRKILKEKLPNHKILYRGREPYLFPNDFEISITNSFPFAALAIAKHKIGIDIEAFNPKIERIQHKFLKEEEALFIPKTELVKFLTIIWTVKESLYKIHHSNYFSLKQHYEVQSFDLDALSEIDCRVHDDVFSDHYKAKIVFFDNYCLSIVV